MAWINTAPLDDLLPLLEVTSRTVAGLRQLAPTEETEILIANNDDIAERVAAELARREEIAQRILEGVAV